MTFHNKYENLSRPFHGSSLSNHKNYVNDLLYVFIDNNIDVIPPLELGEFLLAIDFLSSRKNFSFRDKRIQDYPKYEKYSSHVINETFPRKVTYFYINS